MNTCKRCGLVIADTAMGTTVPLCKCHWRSQEKIVLSREITDTTEQFLHNDLAEYKQRAEAAEAKLMELEMQEPVAYTWPSYLVQLHEYKESSMFEEASLAAPIPLYAKPFLSPKQDDK